MFYSLLLLLAIVISAVSLNESLNMGEHEVNYSAEYKAAFCPSKMKMAFFTKLNAKLS